MGQAVSLTPSQNAIPGHRSQEKQYFLFELSSDQNHSWLEQMMAGTQRKKCGNLVKAFFSFKLVCNQLLKNFVMGRLPPGWSQLLRVNFTMRQAFEVMFAAVMDKVQIWKNKVTTSFLSQESPQARRLSPKQTTLVNVRLIPRLLLGTETE